MATDFAGSTFAEELSTASWVMYSSVSIITQSLISPVLTQGYTPLSKYSGLLLLGVPPEQGYGWIRKYKKLNMALNLSGETSDAAGEACFRWYIAQAFGNASKEYTPRVMKQTDRCSKDFYKMALQLFCYTIIMCKIMR